jgi:phosphoribosyl-AMP cyclohydrolase
MLGFMNEEALKLTEETGKVHFLAEPKIEFGLKANLLKIIYM